MRRVFRLSAILIALLSAWYALLSDIPVKIQEPLRGHVLLLPLYAIVLFGLYSIANIVYHVITFPECPEEAKSLEKERKMAIEDLKSKGLDVLSS